MPLPRRKPFPVTWFLAIAGLFVTMLILLNNKGKADRCALEGNTWLSDRCVEVPK